MVASLLKCRMCVNELQVLCEGVCDLSVVCIFVSYVLCVNDCKLRALCKKESVIKF